MSTILVLDNRPKTGSLYSVAIEAYTAATVVDLESIEDATEYLLNHAPRIVIVRALIDQRDIASKFHQLIITEKLETHLIILGKSKVTYHDATIFDESVSVKEIIRKCASILGVTAKDMVDQDVGSFYPVRIDLLCPNLQLVCPIYKRNREKDGEIVKILEKGHHIHDETLMILKSSGDENIFVQSTDRLKFINSLTVFLGELLSDDNLNLKEGVLLASKSYQVVRDAAKRMMITPEIIQMTESNIATMTSIVNRIPKLKELLDMTTNEVSLLFRHSLLTCYIASHIIDKMEWGTRDQKVKIAFVSFFHDITLSDDKHILIHSEEDLALHRTTQEQRFNITQHAINAAKVLSKYFSSLPFGVDTIVKQHHGTRDGIGFVNYPMSISPLALVFIVAEEWVYHIINAEQLGMPVTREDVMEKIRRKYTDFSYISIINALRALTI